MTFDAAPAVTLSVSRRRFEDLAATVLAAEAAGLRAGRWTPPPSTRRCASSSANRSAAFRPSSTCAQKCCCGRSGSRPPPPTPRRRRVAGWFDDDDQLAIAAAIAAAIGIGGAKANARDCIQVLGGIGITWEHDAHLYLRRAYGIGQFLGGRPRWLRRVAALTLDGVRRELQVDLESVAHLQPEIAAAVAEVAALPVEKRQPAMAESGLLAPHWPKPHGRNASPAEQLLIDQELAAAGVQRPDLVIGWWAVPTIPRGGHAGSDRPVRAGHAARRADLVPVVPASRVQARIWPH